MIHVEHRDFVPRPLTNAAMAYTVQLNTKQKQRAPCGGTQRRLFRHQRLLTRNSSVA